MTDGQTQAPTLRRALGFYDITNVTVGAIVGADIYIAAAITAGMLGPASLVAWALAGLLATIIALTLAECARLVPVVGGPYAYTSRAFGPLAGFLAGWSMWIAELTALPVFAIAFTNYLGYFVDISDVATHTIRIAFLVVLTSINVVSVRAAGRVNDALTALKLAPLLLLVLGGLVYMALHINDAADNLTPFAPFGFHEFPSALVLIFWAYAGFELSTVPAGEVKDPGKTIPRALATGMLIVTAFYMSTNLVLYSLVDHGDLVSSATPLVLAGTLVFGSIGGTLLAGGAMISVSGSDESDILGASRLGYAMSADGLLPRRLALIHPRFRTPYVALIAQASLAIALTFVDQIAKLISFSVVDLSFSFLMCALSLIHLHADSKEPSFWQRVLPFVCCGICVGLFAATSTGDKLTGGLVLLSGLAVYFLAAPRKPRPQAIALLTNPERQLAHIARRRMRFLGGPIGWLGGHRSP